MVWTVQKTEEFPKVQFLDVFVHTVVKPVMIPQSQFSDKDVDCLLFWGPDVQKTVNSSQLQFLDGVDVPVVVQREVACPAVDADSWRCEKGLLLRSCTSGAGAGVVSTGIRPP